MVTMKNIETFGTIWTFSFRGVVTFVASGLDINGCIIITINIINNNKFTVLYKVYMDYFTLCQSAISSVNSYEKI